MVTVTPAQLLTLADLNANQKRAVDWNDGPLLVLAGYWAVTVSRNWRVVFRFEGGDATDVDLIDYH